MKLAELLKGCQINYDAIQSIKGLTVVPLVTDPEFSLDDRYEDPYNWVAKTHAYGDIEVINKGDKTLIVAPHQAVITNYAAQDHLLVKGVKINDTARLKDSRCVQSSQAGSIRPSLDGVRKVTAPLALREIAWSGVDKSGAGVMWQDLARYNQRVGAGSAQQLKDYFKTHDETLDKFIAHFERLENCIGYIVMHGREIVAIDKFPSFSYTASIWRTMIRDAYASLVIESGPLQEDAFLRIQSKKRKLKSFLADVLMSVENDRTDLYRERLGEVMEVDFSTKAETNGSTMLESEGYIGQVVEDSGFYVMVNLLKRSTFNPENYRRANELRNKARRQRQFSL